MPVGHNTTLGDEDDLFDRSANGKSLADLDQAGHWLSGNDAGDREPLHGRNIVGYQDTSLVGGEFEDTRVATGT